MRSRSLSTKLIFVFLFLAVAAYFSVQAGSASSTAENESGLLR